MRTTDRKGGVIQKRKKKRLGRVNNSALAGFFTPPAACGVSTWVSCGVSPVHEERINNKQRGGVSLFPTQISERVHEECVDNLKVTITVWRRI